MQLYYSDLLSARKACAVARYLKAPVAFVYLDPAKGDHKTPAYVALNPNAKVPTLVKGDRVTWEADAILCQLSDDMGADLWPHDARQIDIVRWFSWNAQHLTRAGGGLYFENIIKKRFNIGAPDPKVIEEEQNEFRRYAAVLSDHLKGRTWLVGDTLTVADFSVAVTLPYAQDAQIPLSEFPEICRWHDQLNELEAWREPFPSR
ncbi:MAG TPA: glutathione S-transferase family protein [Rhizomicrobium sp.]|nr:glutathione S-transferase family protein [Rhizomicrobium sp.]